MKEIHMHLFQLWKTLLKQIQNVHLFSTFNHDKTTAPEEMLAWIKASDPEGPRIKKNKTLETCIKLYTLDSMPVYTGTQMPSINTTKLERSVIHSFN